MHLRQFVLDVLLKRGVILISANQRHHVLPPWMAARITLQGILIESLNSLPSNSIFSNSIMLCIISNSSFITHSDSEITTSSTSRHKAFLKPTRGAENGSFPSNQQQNLFFPRGGPG